MAKYKCVGGPYDGGETEAFSDISVGHVINISSRDFGSGRGDGQERYEYRADGRLHHIGFKPNPPIDPEIVERLMGGSQDELVKYITDHVVPILRAQRKAEWGDWDYHAMADKLEQLAAERV